MEAPTTSVRTNRYVLYHGGAGNLVSQFLLKSGFCLFSLNPAVVADVSKKYIPVKPMNCVSSASCNGNKICGGLVATPFNDIHGASTDSQ